MSLLIDSLLILLSPIDTRYYTIISNLKHEYIEYLDAPVPFIIGVNKQIWDNHLSLSHMRRLELDTSNFAFYIDKDFTLFGNVELPLRHKSLVKALDEFKEY